MITITFISLCFHQVWFEPPRSLTARAPRTTGWPSTLRTTAPSRSTRSSKSSSKSWTSTTMPRSLRSPSSARASPRTPMPACTWWPLRPKIRTRLPTIACHTGSRPTRQGSTSSLMRTQVREFLNFYLLIVIISDFILCSSYILIYSTAHHNITAILLL